jgi:hypothetical protein
MIMKYLLFIQKQVFCKGIFSANDASGLLNIKFFSGQKAFVISAGHIIQKKFV